MWQQNDAWTRLFGHEIDASQQILSHWNATIRGRYAEYAMHRAEPLDENGTAELWNSWHEDFLQSNRFTAKERDLLHFHLRMGFHLDSGIPMEQHELAGLNDNWGWKEYPGDDVIAKDGMQSLVNLLAEDIRRQGGDIRLEERAAQIKHDRSGCRVRAQGNQSWFADVCIVALPLGVLKQHADRLFVPLLNDEKQDALRRAGLGTLDTVAVEGIVQFVVPMFPPTTWWLPRL